MIVEPRRPDAAEARAHARSGAASRSSARARRRSTRAEDREQFNALCERLGIPQPDGGDRDRRPTTRSRSRPRIGYPVLVRPSYVLGGRAMEIVYDDTDLRRAMGELARTGIARARRRPVGRAAGAHRPLPRRRGRGRRRRAARPHRRGARSAGSWSTSRKRACTPATPRARSRRRRSRPRSLQTIEQHTRALADALEVVGLLNVQYAVQGRAGLRHRGEPAREPHGAVREQGDRRAARQDRGAASMVGATFDELRAEGLLRPPADGGHVAVKEAVLPFNRFPEVDTMLGPGDALDRRGHGHRPHVRHGVREEPGRRGQHAARARARSSSRSPTATRSRARRGAALRRARLRDRGDRRHRRRCSRSNGIPVDTVVAKVGEDGRRRRGRSHLVGQGRPRGQHAARPRPARRRHAHPPGGDRRTASRASRRSPPRSRPRPGIAEEARARRPRCARCRSTTATASCGSRCEREHEAAPVAARRASTSRVDARAGHACRTRSSPRRARSGTAPRSRRCAIRAGSARSR